MRPVVGRVRVLRCAVVGLALLASAGCWNGGSAELSQRPEPAAPVVRGGPDVRFVSPDGNDRAPGTERAPWRTLGHALPVMNPGQLLYVREGTYREDLRRLGLNQGQPDDRIVVRAYPGERALVRGLVWLRQPSYWTIDGLDVTWDKSIVNPPPHMVKVTGGVGWSWSNSEIWGARAAANVLVAGYSTDEPADWSFVGNCVHDMPGSRTVRRGSNLSIGDMGDAAGPGTLERNLFFDVPTGRNLTLGRDPMLRNPDTESGGPVNVLVRFNTLFDSATAVALAGETADVRIERNILGNASSRTLVRSRRLGYQGGVKVQQNLGVAAEGFFQEKETKNFADPDGGLSPNRAGNALVQYIDFDDTSSCDGFNSGEGDTLTYGTDAIG